MGVHQCRQSEDPRHADRCACGKPIAKPRRRNLEFERDITQHAARGVADPAALIQHAEVRAGGALARQYVSDPMTIAVDRDHIREAREELPDARNRIVWWLEDHLEDDSASKKIEALRLICVAYELLKED